MSLSENSSGIDDENALKNIGENSRCAVKTPDECSEEEIKNFIALVRKGGEVNPKYILSAIYNAEALAFYYIGDNLISVGALKHPDENYKNNVFKKSGSNLNPEDYNYELGWLYTAPENRGKGAGKEVIGEIMKTAAGEKVFATTRSENIAAIKNMERFGFTKSGHAYQSQRGDYSLILHVNNPSNSIARDKGLI